MCNLCIHWCRHIWVSHSTLFFLLALLVTHFPHTKEIVLLSQIQMDVKKWVTQASRGTWKKTSKKTCNAFTCLSILMESFVCEPLVLDLAGSPMDIRRIRRMVLGSQDESNPQVKYSGIFCHQTYEGLSWSGWIFQILGSQTLETRLQLRERLQLIIKETIFIFSFGITCWLPINYIFVLRYLPNYQDPLVHPSSRSQSQKLFGASESR